MADNSWICTRSGRRFYPLDPRVDDICIEDIAHALSNICRFTGHVSTFYSVAEHSWRAALAAPVHELALPLLLHDASEAYLCDVSRPVKHAEGMAFYRKAEERLMRAVGVRFGVSFVDPRIKTVDNRMLMTERRDLMQPPPGHTWGIVEIPYSEVIIPCPPTIARKGFLDTFYELTT